MSESNQPSSNIPLKTRILVTIVAGAVIILGDFLFYLNSASLPSWIYFGLGFNAFVIVCVLIVLFRLSKKTD
jgi:hypothetical protein